MCKRYHALLQLSGAGVHGRPCNIISFVTVNLPSSQAVDTCKCNGWKNPNPPSAPRMDLQQQAASLSEPCRSCGHALGTNQTPFTPSIVHRKNPTRVANVAFNVLKLPEYFHLDVYVSCVALRGRLSEFCRSQDVQPSVYSWNSSCVRHHTCLDGDPKLYNL